MFESKTVFEIYCKLLTAWFTLVILLSHVITVYIVKQSREHIILQLKQHTWFEGSRPGRIPTLSW